MDAYTRRKAGLEPDYVPEDNLMPWWQLIPLLVFGLVGLFLAGLFITVGGVWLQEVINSW